MRDSSPTHRMKNIKYKRVVSTIVKQSPVMAESTLSDTTPAEGKLKREDAFIHNSSFYNFRSTRVALRFGVDANFWPKHDLFCDD